MADRPPFRHRTRPQLPKSRAYNVPLVFSTFQIDCTVISPLFSMTFRAPAELQPEITVFDLDISTPFVAGKIYWPLVLAASRVTGFQIGFFNFGAGKIYFGSRFCEILLSEE